MNAGNDAQDLPAGACPGEGHASPAGFPGRQEDGIRRGADEPLIGREGGGEETEGIVEGEHVDGPVLGRCVAPGGLDHQFCVGQLEAQNGDSRQLRGANLSSRAGVEDADLHALGLDAVIHGFGAVASGEFIRVEHEGHVSHVRAVVDLVDPRVCPAGPSHRPVCGIQGDDRRRLEGEFRLLVEDVGPGPYGIEENERVGGRPLAVGLAHHLVARTEDQVGVAGSRHRQEIGDVPGVVDTGPGLER